MERILIRSQDLLQGIPAEVSDNQIGVGYTAVVLSADAQATIAALQDTIMQMGGQAAVLAKDAMAAKEQVAALQAQHKLARDAWWESVKELEAQLTQRTAELAAAKKVKADYDRWLSGGVYFTTAEYMAHIDEHRAELERVRGELVEATHNANVYQSLYSTGCMDRALLENELRDIRTLVLALPKVEGAVEVSAGDDGWYILPLLIRCVTKEQADGIAALLQHRQGMEG